MKDLFNETTYEEVLLWTAKVKDGRKDFCTLVKQLMKYGMSRPD